MGGTPTFPPRFPGFISHLQKIVTSFGGGVPRQTPETVLFGREALANCIRAGASGMSADFNVLCSAAALMVVVNAVNGVTFYTGNGSAVLIVVHSVVLSGVCRGIERMKPRPFRKMGNCLFRKSAVEVSLRFLLWLIGEGIYRGIF